MSNILGQEETILRLGAELAQGRLVHAYLFVGIPGSGRATLARLLAQASLCDAKPPPFGGCGRCRQCRLFLAGSHPDFLELPREESLLRIHLFARRQVSDVENVEAPLSEFLHYTPVYALRRVCLVADAERMVEAAANAFLKTLEEPPAASLILLTAAERDRLLPTIVSRCRLIHVRPLSAPAVAAELERRGLAAGEKAAAIAGLAEGALGKALSLAASEAEMEEWQWLEKALAEFTPTAAVRLAEGLQARAAAGGGDSAKRRAAALRLLERLALAIRRRLRRGLAALPAANALEAVWRAGEQLAANVPVDTALAAAALAAVAALQGGERP